MDVKMVEVSPRPPSCSGGVFCRQNQKRKWSCSTCFLFMQLIYELPAMTKCLGGWVVFCYCSQQWTSTHANVAINKSDTENNSANINLQNLTLKFRLDWILFFVMADVKYALAFEDQRLRFCTMFVLFTIWTYMKSQNLQGHTDVYISLPTQMWLQESAST